MGLFSSNEKCTAPSGRYILIELNHNWLEIAVWSVLFIYEL